MNYDIIVLGSGPGGYVAAIRASQLGLKVAVIEKESLGGICLNWGCIPTKALLKSAQVYNEVKHASDYGIEIGDYNKNFDQVVQRSRRVADKMSKGVQFLMKKNKIDVILGFGKLISNNQILVTDSDGKEQTYDAKHIIVATGARAKELPNVKIDGEKVIEYRKAMTLPSQPKSMIVMGSGAIGVEFSYFYQSMGTEVTIVEYLDKIVPNEDADVSKELEKIFKKSGMNIYTSSSVEQVDTSGDGVVAMVKTADGEKQLQADILLSAAGITANIEGIGLETLGIETNKGKIDVDNMYMTGVNNVYAIGDATHGQALAHVASKEAIICVENIAHKEGKFAHAPDPLDYNNVPACTYCTPEIASVGLTEQQAKEQGYEVNIGKFPFSASGKASAAGHNEGFVKVIFDAKYGEWLGTHMIGYNVTEMIAETVVGRKLETTYHEVLNAIHPHPTMSEAVMEAVAASQGEVIHL